MTTVPFKKLEVRKLKKVKLKKKSPKRGKRRSAKEIMFDKYNVHPGKKKKSKKKDKFKVPPGMRPDVSVK